MSLTRTAPQVSGTVPDTVPAPPGVRRVRHQARDVVTLMAFSAATSTAVAVALLVLAQVSRTGR